MNGPIFDENWIRSDGNGGVIIGDADPVPPADIPQIVAWIYKAATGKQPITLPRYDLEDGASGGYGWTVRTVRGKVSVETVFLLPPDDARTCAAVIVAAADLVQHGPDADSAEVERLTSFLNDEMDTDPTALARRLLGAFDVKERA
jgi:hypothetical protein